MPDPFRRAAHDVLIAMGGGVGTWLGAALGPKKPEGIPALLLVTVVACLSLVPFLRNAGQDEDLSDALGTFLACTGLGTLVTLAGQGLPFHLAAVLLATSVPGTLLAMRLKRRPVLGA